MPKYPSYVQFDTMDCGATSLRMVAKFYGRSYPANVLRERCHTSREGVSMLAISDAAESIGFRTTGVKLTFQQLCEDIPLPAIIHWNQQHFVVLYDIKKQKGKYIFHIADPAIQGVLKYDNSTFEKCWFSTSDDSGQKIGMALLLEPSPSFYNEEDVEDKGLHFRYLLRYIRPYKNYIAQLLLGLLTGSAMSLIMPFLTQSMVDSGIGNNDMNIVVMILIAQVMLTLGQSANGLIRSWLMLHITSRISIALISDFLAKLMRLPIAYFDSKMVGDIMQRMGDTGRIQGFITGSFISIIVALITFVVYGIIMAGYNLTILMVFLTGSTLYALWVVLFMKRRRELDHMRFQEAAGSQTNIVQLISGMQDIKLNNCEKQKRWLWENIQVKLYKIGIKGMTLSQIQGVGGLFIDQIKNVLISFLAVSSVISGEMTLGMMLAMQYIIGQLNGPVSQFIGFLQATQDAKISLERLNEIHGKEDEEGQDKDKIRDIPTDCDLILKDVMFQYNGPNSEKVLEGINITIEANKMTAIVGASGSGKTTILKILLGFYTPIEGSVLLNKTPLYQYSDSVWRSKCAVVMQEGFIFSDTIAGNIGVMDDNPNMTKVRQAVDIANVGEFIESLPLRYNTKIGIDGHGLSTGQKQRILIARAAYKDAKYIMFDEATNSLDANNERVIMEKLNSFFNNKTAIIVAHRLSTVKNADKIIVLDKGKVVEEGTHNSLIEEKGYYYNLIKDQLELGN